MYLTELNNKCKYFIMAFTYGFSTQSFSLLPPLPRIPNSDYPQRRADSPQLTMEAAPPKAVVFREYRIGTIASPFIVSSPLSYLVDNVYSFLAFHRRTSIHTS